MVQDDREQFEINDYDFATQTAGEANDLQGMSKQDQQQLIMSGMDISGQGRSGTYLHVDHAQVQCSSSKPGVEVLDINQALEKYSGLPEYYFQSLDRDKDEYTRKVAKDLHGGYFIRTEKGAKVLEPVQSCLYIKGDKVGQNIHNIVVVEEDSELHIITGCAVSNDVQEALHLGVSEFYVRKGGKLTFTMVHNWDQQVNVRPRTIGVVEEGGVFVNNYVLMKPVRSLQSYPTIYVNGSDAVATFNSVMVTPPGSYVNNGSRIVLNAPNTRGEIISRAITTGGTIIAPGHIVANAVPARGHLECKGLILEDGVIHAIPELQGSMAGVELSHEAAVGKIAQEEIEYLMARGLDEEEATSTIVRGFLNIDVSGLPEPLRQTIEKTIEECGEGMF